MTATHAPASNRLRSLQPLLVFRYTNPYVIYIIFLCLEHINKC